MSERQQKYGPGARVAPVEEFEDRNGEKWVRTLNGQVWSKQAWTLRKKRAEMRQQQRASQ